MANALNVQAWSTTAASNDGADSTIGTVANTSAPNVVDDWVRGVMAAIAKYADDTGGALVAGGSATALTVTTGQALSSGHIANGLALKVRTASAATGAATIAIDGLTAVDIKANNGSAIASGDWASGAILDLVYSSTATAFIAANIIRHGYVLLETGNFASAANKDIGLDSYPGYSSYEIVIHRIAPATDNTTLRMLVSTDGGSTFITTNGYRTWGIWTIGAAATQNTTLESLVNILGQVGNGADEGASGTIRIYNAGATAFRAAIESRMLGQEAGGTNITGCYFQTIMAAAGDITDVRFNFSSGNIAAVGSYSLYGIR